MRACLPGSGNGTQRRRPEPDGVQPLCGDTLLLQQLSLQGKAVQLPALFRLAAGEPAWISKSGCARAKPRSDEKVHLLRPTDSGRKDPDGEEKPPNSRW